MKTLSDAQYKELHDLYDSIPDDPNTYPTGWHYKLIYFLGQLCPQWKKLKKHDARDVACELLSSKEYAE